MNCTDPKRAQALLGASEAGTPAWEEHLASCRSCRDLEVRTAALSREQGGAVHPAGEVLVTWDEEPATLDPGTREWISRHVDACEVCREALDAVSAEAAEPHAPASAPATDRQSGPRRFHLWPLLAAAGWLLAAVIAIVDRPEAPGGVGALLAIQDLTLSTTRGADPLQETYGGILRLHLVLGSDVPAGTALGLRILGEDGRTILAESWEVNERDEWERPVLTLDRNRLPEGPLTIEVTPPGEPPARFELP